MQLIQRTILLVIDSLGVGELPDSEQYQIRGANTLGKVCEADSKMQIPNLASLGLGNLSLLKHVGRTPDSNGFFGKLRKQSDGTDTISSHWEICGLKTENIFHSNPKGLFPQFLEKMEFELDFKFKTSEKITGFPIPRLIYLEHVEEQKPILFYGEDQSMNIVCHPDILDESEMTWACHIARTLADNYGIVKVNGVFYRQGENENEQTFRTLPFPMKPPAQTLLDQLESSGIPVYGIGNLDEFFPDQKFTKKIETEEGIDTLNSIVNLLEGGIEEDKQCFIYGFIENKSQATDEEELNSYMANRLKEIDEQLPKLFRSMNTSDLLIITSTNGKDPEICNTMNRKNTREYIPLLVYSRILNVRTRGNLGVRRTMSDIAETISDIYSLDTHYGGDSFWSYVISRI